MITKERTKKFNKRWSITSVDSYEESIKKFKTRILNIFYDIDNHVSGESIAFFCQFYGINDDRHSDKWSATIEKRLIEENREKEFYRLIEVIFSLDFTPDEGVMRDPSYSKDIFLEKVKKAIDLSDVNVSITMTEGEIVLYPKGEKILDIKLVNAPLSFLDKESAEHFSQALQFYQAKNYIKSAEDLRRSLEEFLRSKLQNSKGLKENISKLQKILKSAGGSAEIRNNMGSIFLFLDKYFNNNSKHNDGDINDTENEFLIYQIGLLMRYIERIF